MSAPTPIERRSRRRYLLLGVAMAILVLGLVSPAAAGSEGGPDGRDKKDYTFAVIGDIPYGDAEIAQFPKVVAQINADPQVQLVAHLGDIKNGSSACSDSYFRLIKSDFDQFADPLVYTIGDNEWTDCHRPNNGGYNPLERLATVRSLFFWVPGRTLGQHPISVDSQAASGYPENVQYERARVAFAAPHIVGSNDSLASWTGNAGPTPEQSAEVLGRTAADIQLIRDTFATAKRRGDRAVVLFTQADMFDPTVSAPAYADYFAFTPIVRALVEESRSFRGPVYLFNGDSHVYNADHPLASGSPWLAFYGVPSPATNLTRITVDGSDNANDYLRVTVSPRSASVLGWERVPFATPRS